MKLLNFKLEDGKLTCHKVGQFTPLELDRIIDALDIHQLRAQALENEQNLDVIFTEEG